MIRTSTRESAGKSRIHRSSSTVHEPVLTRLPDIAQAAPVDGLRQVMR
ncbi:hypothetical protein [Streptomyces shaanxiensis]